MTSQSSSWEIGLDGQPLRSENFAKHVLRQMGMVVQASNTFGRNDCLIDSVLLSLQASGYITASLNMQQRNMTCVRVRDALRAEQLTSESSDDYLSHEEHLQSIFNCLLMECGNLWVDIVKARSRCSVCFFFIYFGFVFFL